MIRLRRSEVLWIVRGIRLVKFVRCCARTVRRLIHPPPDGAEAETVEAVGPPLPSARVFTAEGTRVEREPPRRRSESPAPCADRRPGADVSGSRRPQGAAPAAPTHPRH